MLLSSLDLEVIEESADQWRVQVGDIELGRRFPGLALGEDQQQLEGVAISGDGVRAGLALTDQPISEVGLEGRGECAHARRSRWLSSFSPARAISSGAADKYQNVCLGSLCPK